MSKFLSHDKAKADMTDYLAAKTLEYTIVSHKLVITSSSGHTSSTKACFSRKIIMKKLTLY